MKEKKLPNKIQDYIIKQEGNKDLVVSKEIFDARDDNVELKTELNLTEINYITALMYNDQLLKNRGMKPVYKDFINKYMRLKISHDRKSRQEYVDINKSNDISKSLQDISNAKNIQDVKK